MELDEAKKTVDQLNEREREAFVKTNYGQRMLFISHCIQQPLRDELVHFAEQLGYRVNIVGGGSIVLKTIARAEPAAVVGIACYPELEMAIKEITIPFQAVLLDTDGCKDTEVNLEQAKRILAQSEPQEPLA
jgi:hypothetical protein